MEWKGANKTVMREDLGVHDCAESLIDREETYSAYSNQLSHKI